MSEVRSTPVYRSLLEVRSTAGAEFLLTLGNITVCAVMLLGPRLYWWVAVAYVCQKIFQWMYSRDPQLAIVMARYLREGDVYDPWPRHGSNVKRPLGLGRDLPLC